jgi:phage-related minor tail protein
MGLLDLIERVNAMTASDFRKPKQSKPKLNKKHSNAVRQQKAIVNETRKAKKYYREIKESENFWRNNL